MNSSHINFYFKKLTQVEVGYGLVNVAKYVSCKVVRYCFFFVYMEDGSVMVTFIPIQG